MSCSVRRIGTSAALTTALASVATFGLGASPAAATSPDVVIAEAYGGGGNSGAPYRSDFVELFNRSATPVDLAGWQLHYYSTGGTTPNRTALTGTIAAGGHLLIKQADGAATTAPSLPTPDITGTTAMSASGARVAVVNPAGTVVDLLGWSSGASTSEGAPAGATDNTHSVARTNPCGDTDNNAADFTVGTPTPQNSSAAPVMCGETTPPPIDEPETIAQIQGATHVSPLRGKPVNDVAGVVTTVGPNGVWIQSLNPDDDPATSEGLYVYTRTAPTVHAGDTVLVEGAVSEFRPGGSSGNDNTSLTQIIGPTIEVTGTARVPAPVVLGVDRVAPAQTIEAGDPKNVEYTTHVFDPAAHAIDFYESLESMRVAVKDAQVVGPTASFGEIPVVPGAGVDAVRSERGGVVYSGYDHPNAMRIQLDDTLLVPAGTQMPQAKVGDRIPGLTEGVLDYTFANYKLYVDAPPMVEDGGLTRETTSLVADDKTLAVATFNVENLSMSNPQEKFDRLAAQIVDRLRAPDVVALEEIQDDSGPADDGVVTSTKTVARLAAAIVTAGGPSYASMWVDPADKADGGQPGGNIRQVFLYRTDRKLTPAAAPAGTTSEPAAVAPGADGLPHLSVNPGRVDPTNAAFAGSRKPLAAEFVWRGKNVFVIANHFSSKGGDDPLFGRWQQPVRSSEPTRHAQAQVVRDFVDSILAVNAHARVVVLGDLNDFEFSRTTDILVGSGSTALVDLPRTLAPSARYTYVYEGNSQVLDHILISRGLTYAPSKNWTAYGYDIVHTNSEFPDQDSDHDPQVVHVTARGWHN